jgi:recombination protein RecT
MSTALSTVPETKALLAAKRDDFVKMLAKHVDPDRFERMAINCVVKVPKLLSCDKLSFLKALMECASLGLEPDSTFGYAYILPYGSQAKLIPGYKGLLELARRSGEISTIYAEVVRKDDKFKIVKGLHLDLIHEPSLDPEASDEIIWAYAVARLKDGGVQFADMPRKEIDAIRARSRSGGNGPWVTDFPEMAKKTVLRRLSKVLPMSAEYRKAEALDNDDYDLDGKHQELPTAQEALHNRSTGLEQVFQREPGQDEEEEQYSEVEAQ